MGDVAIFTEMGRFTTGPYGALVATAIHEKHIYKEYIGLDACAANLMRPAMYGADVYKRQGIGGTLKVLAGVGLDHAGIGAGSQLGIDGALGQHGQAVLCSHLIHMALAEHADLLAAVGADDVAHVLHDAQQDVYKRQPT